MIVFCPRSSFIELAAAVHAGSTTADDDVKRAASLSVLAAIMSSGGLSSCSLYPGMGRKEILLCWRLMSARRSTTDIEAAGVCAGGVRGDWSSMPLVSWERRRVACDTDVENEPWRALFRAVGLGERSRHRSILKGTRCVASQLGFGDLLLETGRWQRARMESLE